MFKEGIKNLHQGINNGVGYQTIKDTFKKLHPFWTESFTIRALGYYLLKLAEQRFWLSGIERSLVITLNENNIEKLSA